MLFTACSPAIEGGETDTTSSETFQNTDADTESSAETVTETAAGGDNAKRLTISINTLELDQGTHTVDYLALIEAKGHLFPVKMLSFNLVITD